MADAGIEKSFSGAQSVAAKRVVSCACPETVSPVTTTRTPNIRCHRFLLMRYLSSTSYYAIHVPRRSTNHVTPAVSVHRRRFVVASATGGRKHAFGTDRTIEVS